MLRIGICDESARARHTLHIQLERILPAEAEDVIYEFPNGESTVQWLWSHLGEMDLLLLKEEMHGMSGAETAGRIREFDSQVQIVMLAGRPVSETELRARLGKAQRELADGRNYYTLKNKDGIFRFEIVRISFFCSEKRQVWLVCGGRAYAFYGKLDEVEAALGGRFVRIHRRYLVNPERVDAVGSDHVVIDRMRLPISRGMREQARRALR